MRRWALGIAAVGLVVVAGIHGCGSDSNDTGCGELSEKNACPVVGGGSCDDMNCSAIYACGDDGKWSLVTRCDRDGGYPSSYDDGGGDESDGLDLSMCASGVAPAAYAACTPLEEGDCDNAIAVSCPVQACTLGCYDFLTCGPDGWNDVAAAYCDDMGTLIVVPPSK